MKDEPGAWFDTLSLVLSDERSLNSLTADEIFRFRDKLTRHVLHGGEDIPTDLSKYAKTTTEEGAAFNVTDISYYPAGLQSLLLFKQIEQKRATHTLELLQHNAGIKLSPAKGDIATFVYTPEAHGPNSSSTRHLGKLILPPTLDFDTSYGTRDDDIKLTVNTELIQPRAMLIDGVNNLERGYATIYATDETLSSWSLHCRKPKE